MSTKRRPFRAFVPKEDKLLLKINNDLLASMLLGRHISSIKGRRASLKIKGFPSVPLQKYNKDQITEMYEKLKNEVRAELLTPEVVESTSNKVSTEMQVLELNPIIPINKGSFTFEVDGKKIVMPTPNSMKIIGDTIFIQ